ncbi:hypothetical protein RB653_008359 [Dictyostelium firmibasis]|uniref:Uncharacterized protein n=1 Tax=Dictyostelium firmibasis TaxID=79012 RepID=A0AAN7YR38_9MYCE
MTTRLAIPLNLALCIPALGLISYNKEINILSASSIPSSVKSLTFGYEFNKVISEGSIPSSVKSLTLGYFFDQVLSAGSIPSSVKSLHLVIILIKYYQQDQYHQVLNY